MTIDAHLTRKQERRLQVLRRRRTHLAERVADYHGDSPSWDKAELSAVSWAIRVIEHAAQHGILGEME